MKVILLQTVDKLGKAGDVVTVKEGHARNFLIPKNVAKEATANNMKMLESLKKKQAEEEAAGIQKYSGLVSNVTRVKSIPNTCRVFIDDRVFMCVDMMLAELLNDLKNKKVMVSFTTDGENISTIKGAEELK